MAEDDKIIFFQNKKIRRLWHDEQWYFSVVDVMAILTESSNPRRYWSDLKKQLDSVEGFELYEKIVQLKLPSSDGKYYLTDAANTKSLFRIIQSVPSKRAEPLKQWLAQVGYERIEEIENPELSQQRMKEVYRAKGYSDDWIEKRVRGIAIRDELTDEWKKRDVVKEKEFAILTAEISRGTFGMTPQEYKQFKGLKNENLRDHMDDLELIFSMLGERVSTEITRTQDARGFDGCKDAAKQGGTVAGNARRETEEKIGKSVSTKENYTSISEKKKRSLE